MIEGLIKRMKPPGKMLMSGYVKTTHKELLLLFCFFLFTGTENKVDKSKPRLFSLRIIW